MPMPFVVLLRYRVTKTAGGNPESLAAVWQKTVILYLTDSKQMCYIPRCGRFGRMAVEKPSITDRGKPVFCWSRDRLHPVIKAKPARFLEEQPVSTEREALCLAIWFSGLTPG